MKRIYFYLLINIAFLCRVINIKWYMQLLMLAHQSQGVVFAGIPEYIQKNAFLDASGGLTINGGVVISTNVIILSHDWSFLKRDNCFQSSKLCTELGGAFRPVNIGENSFIGAGAIILPGTTIGKNCIIGAGAVVKGEIESYSIIVGNPAKKIGDTRLNKKK